MNVIVFIPLIIASLQPWAPRAGDAELIRGGAMVVYMDEHVVRGFLPTPCNKLRIDAVVEPVKVYSVIAPGARCLQVLMPFEVVYREVMP
jgi:hypothetical protein